MVDKQAILDLLGHRVIGYHALLARACGGVETGIFLSQLLYWTGKERDPDGWIYKTRLELEEETGLTRRNQETARKKLKILKVLEEQRKGVPAKMHYRLDLDRLAEILNDHNQQTSLAEPAKLDCADPPNKTGGSGQTITENTTETTPAAAENTNTTVSAGVSRVSARMGDEGSLDDGQIQDTPSSSTEESCRSIYPDRVRVAEHLGQGLGLPLPRTGSVREDYVAAARDLIAATDSSDIDGVCAAVDGWFASDDPWAKAVKLPKATVHSIARFYHALGGSTNDQDAGPVYEEKPSPILELPSATMSEDETWLTALKQIRLQVAGQDSQTWLSDSRLGYRNGTWVLVVHSEDVKEWLSNRLYNLILKTLVGISGEQHPLVIEVGVRSDGGTNTHRSPGDELRSERREDTGGEGYVWN